MKRSGKIMEGYRIIQIRKCIWFMVLLLFAANGESFAQQNKAMPLSLTLQDAIALSKSQNKQVRAVKSEENATVADLKDAKNAALPGLEFNGDYQRFSKLTLYNDFLGDAKSLSKRPSPNAAD